MQGSPPRYAIYFTPRPLSPLALFGAAVLGYDSSAGASVPRIALPGIAAGELADATIAPRKYGFHATLAAPFHLADGCSEADMLLALDTFCGRTAPASIGLLQVSTLGDFIALTPAAASEVNALARDSVAFFDSFRAPLGPDDLVRRDNGRLTPRQREHLTRWGYAYVFEDFRFHMTLTGSLGRDEQARFLDALAAAFAPLAGETCEVDAVSLMRQASSSSGFEVIARKVLQGRGR